MGFFLWEKTTNKGYILQRGTIWGGGTALFTVIFFPLTFSLPWTLLAANNGFVNSRNKLSAALVTKK